MLKHTMHGRAGVLALIGLFVTLSCSASDPLTAAQGIFSSQLARIQQSAAAARQQWPANYIAALERLVAERQAAGDLDGWTAVKAESARYRTERSLSAENILDASPVLAATQKQALQWLDTNKREEAEAIVKLQAQYAARLEEMSAEYLRHGDIPKAQAARGEVSRSAGLGAVTAAAFLLAADAPVPSPEQAGTSAQIPDVGTLPVPDGVKVTTSRTSMPPLPSGFSPGRINSTGLETGGAPRVSVAVQQATGTAMADVGTDRRSVYQTKLRFLLSSRGRLPAGCIADLRLCGKPGVTYMGYYWVWQNSAYNRVTRSSGSDLSYSVAEHFTFTLPEIWRLPVCIDVKAVPGVDLQNWEGQEYTGCVLSIFAATGDLLYQGTTLGSLKGFAPTAMAEVLEQ